MLNYFLTTGIVYIKKIIFTMHLKKTIVMNWLSITLFYIIVSNKEKKFFV